MDVVKSSCGELDIGVDVVAFELADAVVLLATSQYGIKSSTAMTSFAKLTTDVRLADPQICCRVVVALASPASSMVDGSYDWIPLQALSAMPGILTLSGKRATNSAHGFETDVRKESSCETPVMSLPKSSRRGLFRLEIVSGVQKRFIYCDSSWPAKDSAKPQPALTAQNASVASTTSAVTAAMPTAATPSSGRRAVTRKAPRAARTAAPAAALLPRMPVEGFVSATAFVKNALKIFKKAALLEVTGHSPPANVFKRLRAAVELLRASAILQGVIENAGAAADVDVRDALADRVGNEDGSGMVDNSDTDDGRGGGSDDGGGSEDSGGAEDDSGMVDRVGTEDDSGIDDVGGADADGCEEI